MGHCITAADIMHVRFSIFITSSSRDRCWHRLWPSGGWAADLATAVVTLPSGEQIKGPLVRADDFMVSLRDVSGWYRSFSRDRVKVEVQDPLSAHRELLGKLTQADVHNLFAYLETLK